MVRFAATECQPLWKRGSALWTKRGPPAPAPEAAGAPGLPDREGLLCGVCVHGCRAIRVKADRVVPNVVRARPSHGPGLCPADGSEYRSVRRPGVVRVGAVT